MIKNLDTDEIVYLYKVDAFLFGGRRLFPQNITQAEYETYAEFGMPVRVGTDGLDIIIEEKDEMGVILFTNPANADERSNMTVRASYDDENTWPFWRSLNPGPASILRPCRSF